MARYKIVENGDPVLRRKAHSVKEVDDRIRTLMDRMTDTMRHAQGVGLAAPQVGISKRVIIVQTEEDKLYALANPEIVARSGLEEGLEGCLSCPGAQGSVLRSQKIMVKGINYDNEKVAFEVDGFTARAFQHEIDHLDGILFIDKAKQVTYE